jgi:hypothetical protein
MKKIYSIVLMAAALLVGTNAWAVSSWSELKAALEQGGTVTLTGKISATVGTSDCIVMNDVNAVLDLNGYDITIQPSGTNTLNPFKLTKGSLVIKSDKDATIKLESGEKILYKNCNVFYLTGDANTDEAYDPAAANYSPYTRFEIGKNVTVMTENGTAVGIYENSVKYAYGVRVDIEGNLTSEGAKDGANEKKCYGIKVNGNVKRPSSADDEKYVPYIHIHPSAVIIADKRANMAGAAAVYASGFAQWLIEGDCSGSTGIYASSGKITVNDANVRSAADTYNAPGSGTHANGSGSAIVLNSRSNYQGQIEMTIIGDSKISSDKGYAFEEIVNTKDGGSKVENISIQGGAFEGGDKGALVITQETAPVVNVGGGNVTGSANVGSDGLAEYLNKQGGTHATLVTDEKGNTTLVISEGNAPTGAPDFNSDATASVKWTGASKEISGAFALKELEINEATAQLLTVKDGATFTVGRVVMGTKAQIIVEAGGKFIVTGEQGIVAPKESNIILQSDADGNQAVFLFNPAVTSNRHPAASVVIAAKEIGYIKPTGDKEYMWYRFALPIQEATTWTKSPNVGSYIYGWNYTSNSWEQLSALSQMKPFKGYTLSAENDGLVDVAYTFPGTLAGGNDNNSLMFERNGFHYFGNSYTGHISIAALVAQLMGDSKIDGTVWVWNEAGQGYVAVPLMRLNEATYAKYREIAPMKTFILKQNGAGTNSTELNYASAVWGNPRYGLVSAAPSRDNVADDSNNMSIYVKAENGKSDFVMFSENGKFSDENEKGYDATKFMNENALNMYATINGENFSAVATDNLEGKTLTINTVNGINYTMSFADVNSADYAIRDNVTGAVIAIEEGATYEFAAQPNSTVEGRFEIVRGNKVATSIENTEVKANAKGIYTVMGQYVGEDFDILPTGIYVVNGVKIVK